MSLDDWLDVEKVKKAIQDHTEKFLKQWEEWSEEERQAWREKEIAKQKEIEENWLGMLPEGAKTCTDGLYD